MVVDELLHDLTTSNITQLQQIRGHVGDSGRQGDSGTVVDKSFSNQKVASSIPCRSVLEQDTESLIAPNVQCAISVYVKCVYIVSRTCVSRFG